MTQSTQQSNFARKRFIELPPPIKLHKLFFHVCQGIFVDR
ncbi:hypothetical protein BURMUCF2_A1660 [Burkholderia multivorans CF2]|nr:hypothetical protein BURMUCF2_A1660 [Burkholderia multivorans CF2]